MDDFPGHSINSTPLSSVKPKLGNSSHHSHNSSATKGPTQTIDIVKDNIYLKGGTSLAEALLGQQKSSYGTNAQGLSIAMRMKKNREAATGGPSTISVLDSNPAPSSTTKNPYGGA